MKQRIAWFVPGGVAPRDSSLHIPALSELSFRLGEQCDLSVFSFSSESTLRVSAVGTVTLYSLPAAWNDSLAKRTRSLLTTFLREHRTSRFDVIHGFWALPCGVLAVFLGRGLGVRSVVSFLGGETANLPGIGYGTMRSWKTRVATLWAARRADVLHLLTLFQKSGLANYQAPRPNMFVVPFGIDTRLFKQKPRRLSRPLRILHVANLTEVKDQETLLRTIALLRRTLPVRLRIVGPDFLEGSIHKLVKSLGIGDAVEFTGFVPNRRIVRHYQWAHLYLQTSLHEGQGMSVMEAMASGTVVCGTHTGILSDLPAECRVTVPPEQPEMLAEAVLNLIHDKKRYSQIRRKAGEWVKMHDVRVTVGRLIEMYEGQGTDR